MPLFVSYAYEEAKRNKRLLYPMTMIQCFSYSFTSRETGYDGQGGTKRREWSFLISTNGIHPGVLMFSSGFHQCFSVDFQRSIEHTEGYLLICYSIGRNSITRWATIDFELCNQTVGNILSFLLSLSLPVCVALNLLCQCQRRAPLNDCSRLMSRRSKLSSVLIPHFDEKSVRSSSIRFSKR